ncbi:hypothetical protein F5146DRAFT_995488 [Armillaria mellea]|nr:hypothetical protein F5146DRAFT_995488 [Armillaria mellea]
MSLSGRVGLITGGGTGTGFTIAKAFAANGATVSIIPLQMDVTNEESLKAGAQHIAGIDGKLDILVNNARFGGSLRDPDFIAKKFAAADPLEPETAQNWADIFALNTIGPFFVVRTFQSLFIKGAHSRFLSSLDSPDVARIRPDKNRLGKAHPQFGNESYWEGYPYPGERPGAWDVCVAVD